ncbi:MULTISPECIES: hypothetical protein [Actinomadura]|uniref:Uncharacterized protein n=1 Tax=Actinomadura bangladeshensis TaxID=453573 RepID=A0A4R4NQU5_9ACTN|nr:hypothetical protein [Actinomadura bangladeshensis]TDC10280.1 hypothetical protein E1284_28210 [Actinomadura bangladeshensis]
MFKTAAAWLFIRRQIPSVKISGGAGSPLGHSLARILLMPVWEPLEDFHLVAICSAPLPR